MSKTRPELRPQRDKRRHIMAALYLDHGLRLRRIARAAGMKISAVENQINSHFAAHCVVCKAELRGGG